MEMQHNSTPLTMETLLNSNATIKLVAGDSAALTRLLPVARKDECIAFAVTPSVGDKRKKPQHACHLRVFPNGRVDFSGWRNGPNTAFQVEAVPSHPQDGVTIRAKTGFFLSVDPTGSLVSSPHPVPLLFERNPRPEESEDPDASARGDVPPPLGLPDVDRDVLSAEDVAHFKQHGYVILRDAVPPALRRDALHHINYQLGQPTSGCEATAQGQIKLPNSACGDPGSDILNRSPKFWSALNVLLGVGNVKPANSRDGERRAQVALRFPQPPRRGVEVPDILPGTRYHIDGMGEKTLCPFSLLCGSHLHPGLRKYYQDRIDDDTQNEEDETKPDLGESVQVLLSPGDVVLAHQLLAHRVGINTSEAIRYQLYYRVAHKEHHTLKSSVIEDPWTEFPVCKL